MEKSGLNEQREFGSVRSGNCAHSLMGKEKEDEEGKAEGEKVHTTYFHPPVDLHVNHVARRRRASSP